MRQTIAVWLIGIEQRVHERSDGIYSHEVLEISITVVRVRRSVIRRCLPCGRCARAERVNADAVEHVIAVARGKGLRGAGIGARAPGPRQTS